MSTQTLPSLIQQMLQPGIYPHAVVEPIQVIQTHISYILLTGEYAYKIKKPLDFGFLDFTTVEKRQHFCLEELRLNQRGAPDIYLEVLPISQQGDRFYLNDPSHPVDYTLKMRQFPQETLLSRLFERGELTEDLMQSLGKQVADYHRQSPTSDYIRHFGEVDQVRQAFDQNFQQTEHYIGGPQTRQQFDQTKAYTDRFFAERSDLFTQRMQGGYIRECHGDLHLGNICLWQDHLILFDCIEFNEPFRFVDVMYDVAYAVMDLDARQRSDLANAYLNRYVEETGDWDGLQVLPIYLNRQTYVRAKVISFLLEDPNASDADKTQAIKTAAGYYKLAWQYTQPRQGRLILMAGLSGSGKSTVARYIARQLNGIHIRSDAVRKHLAGIPLHQRAGTEVYSAEMTAKTYDRLRSLGLSLATQGYTVLLDAKYDRQDFRQAVLETAQAQQLPCQICHCQADLSVLQARLDQRSGDIADATADLLVRQQTDWEPLTEEELTHTIPLDTSGNWQELLQPHLQDLA